MNNITNCHLCQVNEDATYQLKDSIQPPKDLKYDGIFQLNAAFRQILKVTDENPNQKICEECHNELRRIYYFFDRSIRTEVTLFELLTVTKQEPEIEIDHLLIELPVELEAQHPHDKIQNDADTKAITAFETVFLNKESRLNDEEIQQKSYDCKICGRKYASSSSLCKHMKIHKGITYKCRKCPAMFNYIQNLKVHESNHKTSSLKCVCDVCGWMFRTSLGMRLHKKKKHRETNSEKVELNTGQCVELEPIELVLSNQNDESDATLGNRPDEYFEISEYSPHSQDEDSILVYETSQHQESEAEEQREQHAPIENPEIDKCHICNICGRIYTSSSNLCKHKKIHKGISYKCKKCPAVFNYTQNLKVHEKNHKMSRLGYACDVCGWMFSTSISMRQHKSRTHTGRRKEKTESDRIDQCKELKTEPVISSNQDEEVATTSVINSDNFELETISQHSREIDETSQYLETDAEPTVIDEELPKEKNTQKVFKDFQCNLCNRKYTVLKSLQRHERTHQGVTYNCRKCPAAFIYLQSRVIHERRHEAGLLKYSCDVCGWMFPRLSSVKYHKTKNHAGKEGNPETIEESVSNESTAIPANQSNPNDADTTLELDPYQEEDFDMIPIGQHSQDEETTNIDRPINNDELMTTSKTKNPDKTYDCEVCDRKYASSNSLRQHKKLHLGVSYDCRICPAKFSYIQGRNYHERKHKTNSLKSSCDVCGWMFSTLSLMNEHKFMKHTGKDKLNTEMKKATEGNELESKPAVIRQGYACTKCNKLYDTQKDLKRHRRTHLNATFCCTDCPKKFAHIQSLKLHMEVHLGIKYKCDQCDALFQRESSRKIHYLRAHADVKYMCDICSAIFNSSDNLRSHRIRHEIKIFSCPKCPAKYQSDRSLKSHDLRCHRPHIKFYCDQCAAEFPDKTSLNLHLRLHTGKLIDCNECGWQFVTQSEVDAHKRVHDVANFICELCNAKFGRLRDFNGHKRAHSDHTFDCSRCPARFLFYSMLLKHKEIHQDVNFESQNTARAPVPTQEQEKNATFNCDRCNVEYETLEDLEMHKETHIDKQYECDKCPEKFPKHSQLRAHRLTHRGSKVFKCDECDSIFARSISLVSHKRMHSGDMLKCKICDASFLRSSTLNEHQRIHTGEMFDCDECNAKFTNRWALKKHVMIHRAKKPFACEHCGYKTAHYNVMERHRLIHRADYVSKRSKYLRRMPMNAENDNK